MHVVESSGPSVDEVILKEGLKIAGDCLSAMQVDQAAPGCFGPGIHIVCKENSGNGFFLYFHSLEKDD